MLRLSGPCQACLYEGKSIRVPALATRDQFWLHKTNFGCIRTCLFCSSRNYWRWLCRILLERRPRPAPGCWDTQMSYVMTRVLARHVKESPGTDPKAIVPSYCEESYETALPHVWAVTGVIAATRWYKP